MLRAVVFDFNGILVDDEPIHFRLFREVLAEEGLDLSEDDYYEKYLGYDDRGCFEAVLEAAGEEPSAFRVMRLITRKSAYYQKLIRREGYTFFPGGAELVRAVHERGLPLGLVSGALRGEVDGALEQAGLTDCFKAVVTADDVERSKPDPEGYARVMAELNSRPPLPERLLHPHEVVAVEDSPAGIESAAAAGLLTLGVAQTYEIGDLASADAVIESLASFGVDDLERLFGGDRG